MITNTNTKIEEIGYVGVDAGLLMIGDPCYFIGEDSTASKRYNDWSHFLNEQELIGSKAEDNHQMTYPHGGEGLGVVFGTTHGDGVYPVYAAKDEHGRPRFAIVVMDGSDINEIVK
jgi:Protein of unknown function (DUF4241)